MLSHAKLVRQNLTEERTTEICSVRLISRAVCNQTARKRWNNSVELTDRTTYSKGMTIAVIKDTHALRFSNEHLGI